MSWDARHGAVGNIKHVANRAFFSGGEWRWVDLADYGGWQAPKNVELVALLHEARAKLGTA